METITSVQPREDFHLVIFFNTGEVRLFDLRPYVEKGVFRRLQDLRLFGQAHVASSTVCWPGGLVGLGHCAGDALLYDRSTPLLDSYDHRMR
jgi:hypothetical protein